MEKSQTYSRSVTFSKKFSSTPNIGFNTDGTFTVSVTNKSTSGFTMSIVCGFHDGQSKSFTWNAYC